jgi:hypothetical protein
MTIRSSGKNMAREMGLPSPKTLGASEVKRQSSAINPGAVLRMPEFLRFLRGLSVETKKNSARSAVKLFSAAFGARGLQEGNAR